MHCVCVRSGRSSENPVFPDRTEPDRHRQAASRSNGYEANSNDGRRNLQMGWSDRSRGDEERNLGSILRAYADRVDQFRLKVVEDCRRKGPIHSSARIDVTTVVAHVRHRLLRIKIERRRMAVDNVFRERSPMTKEAVAYPKLGFGGLLVEGHAGTNPRVNIITDFVFVVGRERTHPFLGLPERGRCAQGGDGCIPAIDEEVCNVLFRFRRSKHELFVIAPKADSALGLEALDDLKDLA
jgi:hypothetical protein